MNQSSCVCIPKLIEITEPTQEELKTKFQCLILSEDQLIEIRDKFLADIDKGLRKKPKQKVPLECFVSFVQDLPDGTEEGKSINISFGGADVEIVLLELQENHIAVWVKHYLFPNELISGKGTELFDFLGDCLADFCQNQNITEDEVALCFIFGFPVRQNGVRSGILKRWAKGIDYPDLIEKNIVTLLEEAIDKRELNLKLCCILNDTVGVLVSTAWKYPSCKIGVILGSGSNACYLEDQKNASFFNEPNNGSGKVIINLEWANFGLEGELNNIKTVYDTLLDSTSKNPGVVLFEKMTGGFYIGELVRITLKELTSEKILFNGEGVEILSTPDCFLSKYIIDIESEPPGKTKNCCNILSDLGLKATKEDCINVRYICECYTRRLAAITAACLAALLKKINEPYVTIGIDGEIYLNHPHIHDLLMASIPKLVDSELAFNIVRAKNSTGKGGAITAACIKRRADLILKQQQQELEEQQLKQEPICTETECA